MKAHQKFQRILLIAAIIGLVSCKEDKKDNNDPKDSVEMEIENDGDRQAMPEDAAGVGPAARTGGTTGASNNLKMGTENKETAIEVNLEDLYDRLEMTDEQIEKFRTAMGNDQLNRLKNTSGELPGNLYENMESVLEPLLDQAQFEEYREWKKRR
jgi:hypothetical protein